MAHAWDPDDDHNIGKLMGAKTFLFVVETKKVSSVCMPPSKYESETNMFSPAFVPTSNSVEAMVLVGQGVADCTEKSLRIHTEFFTLSVFHVARFVLVCWYVSSRTWDSG